MKIRTLEFQVNGERKFDALTAAVRALVSNELKAKGIKVSEVGDVDIYVNVENGKASAHYVCEQATGTIEL